MRIWLGVWLLAEILWADAHIFVYHRFGDSRHSATNTSLAVLKKQFDYFKTHGYEVVPLSRLVGALRNGEPVPDRWVILTIDDSFKSFYRNGLPIFKRYGYPFTLFVYVKATEERYGDFMNWDQVREAAKYGEIGYHSYAHAHMVSLSDEALRKDFQKGLALMRKRLGFMPRSFAYPYGEYDARVKKIAESYGFAVICNQNVGAVSAKSDRYDLNRIALTGDPTLSDKLRLKFLPATWISPKKWPKNGVVGRVKIRIDEPQKAKKGWLYLTGYGWKKVPIVDNEVDVDLNRPLKYRRSRLILKLRRDKISTKILVKP